MVQGEIELSEEMKQILSTSIYDVGFSRRTINALGNADLRYIKEVVNLTDGQLLRVPNFGRTCLEEVKNYAKEKGLIVGGKY
ncbi:DNA-directed RNA polymerase subunit alpha C-terminal domain-containing protein [Prevotella amnii]|uniref:RNA polymerase alpha subunit C-terminal domain-containing protein n=1 Tax=Prevotella amnii DNF00058 TaxID=1401066 RepID=A0A096AZB3_9BACT|nr:DNA-directed RNA polymerase subunit alpha C-terminal domain-containing protein [Prevotella amnii]KGF52388.1 hypothetical protein HMPREF9302_03620 [Prevotella amnii DNF00058]